MSENESVFNPDAFLATTTEDANSTERIPVPAAEYIGLIDKIDAREWRNKDKGTSGVVLDIVWILDDASLRELLGRDTVTCRQSVMLDMTENGGLDMGKGKNVQLGRLREALDLNTPGQPFSFAMMPGKVARVKVEHRVHEGNIYDEVKSAARM